jgi:transposase-like protein
MAAADRNAPKLSHSSESKYTLMEFLREFPDDAACLDWLWRERHSQDGSHAHCPKCERERKFHRCRTRASYTCDHCGHHVHPMKGTIFERSSTSLHLWFYGIFLMSQTRCCVSAKQLERELGVHYKTAYRMFQKIRYYLMCDEPEPLSGAVEADETYVGGKARHKGRGVRGRPSATKSKKVPVFAMRERGGRVHARVLDGPVGSLAVDEIRLRVLPGSIVYTDEFAPYRRLRDHGFDHRMIKHGQRRHGAFVYVEGDVHTNTIENYFSLVKGSLRGVYKGVSRKHLQSYLDEISWRMNHRLDEQPMFQTLIERAAA